MSSNPLFSCIKPYKKFTYNLQNQKAQSSMQQGKYNPIAGTSTGHGSDRHSRSAGTSKGQGHSEKVSVVQPAAKRRKTEEGEEWDDDDDFQLTQKEFENIDVMASQALSNVHGNTDPGPSSVAFRPPMPVKARSAPASLHQQQHSTPTARFVRPEPPNTSAVYTPSGNTTGSSSSTVPGSSSSCSRTSSSSLRSESSVEIPMAQQRKASLSSTSSNGSSESFTTSFFKSQVMDSVREDLEKCKKKISDLEKETEDLKGKLYAKEGEVAILRQNLTGKEEELSSIRQEKIKRIGQQNREQSEKEKQLQAEVQNLKSQLEFQKCEMIELREKCHNLEVRLNEAGRGEQNRSPVYSPKVKRVGERSPKGKSAFPTEQSFLSQPEPGTVPTFGAVKTRDAGTMVSTVTLSSSDVIRQRKFCLAASSRHESHSFLSSLSEGGAAQGVQFLLQNHAQMVDTHYFLFDRDQSHLLSPRPTRRLSECKELLKVSPEKSKSVQQKVVNPQHQTLAIEGFQCLLGHRHPTQLTVQIPNSSSSHDLTVSSQLSPATSEMLANFSSLPPYDLCGLLFLPLISDYLKQYINLMDHSVERSLTLSTQDSTPSSGSTSSRSIHSSSCDTSLESVTSSLEILMNEGAVFANTLESLAVQSLSTLQKLCLQCESVRYVICRKEDFLVEDITKSPRKRLKLSTHTSDDSHGSPAARRSSNQLIQDLCECNLLSKIFRLANPGRLPHSKSNEGRKYSIHVIEKSLKVLCALAENIKEEHAESFLPVLSNGVITNCLECHDNPDIVFHTIHLLTSLTAFNKIVSSLCVTQEGCVLQYLYEVCQSCLEVFSPADLTLLCTKMISFLSGIIATHKGGLTVLLESNCGCSVQVVQCIVQMAYQVLLQYEEEHDDKKFLILRDFLSLMHSFMQYNDQLYRIQHKRAQNDYVLLVCGMVQIFKQDPDLYDQELKILSDMWDFDQDDSELNLSDSETDQDSMDMS